MANRYIPVTPEEAEDEKRHTGNIGLPFGLCAKYGIHLPGNATPRMAWDALKQKTGLTPEQIYKDLRERENEKRERAESIYDDEAPLSHEEAYSDTEKQFLSFVKQANIEYRAVKRNSSTMKHEEIVAKVAGGDKTNGSCVSVALAYIGNVVGFDVADFRGGESQRFFATRRNVKELLSFDGINSFTVEGYNDFTAANEVLSHAEQNVEYLFIAGKHAAIVRLGETGFEYLELQSPTNNGYRQLTKAGLKDRFGCQKSHTVYGNKLKSSSHLVRVDSFGNSKAFIKALGYLNTATQNQQKGESGSVK